MSGRILVVGAGFAGATHARELAEAGFEVDVIDRRPHVAGNAYDEVSTTGIRIHRYGPHLLHTSNERVIRWLSRFGAFLSYEHRVQAVLADGRHVPLPVNRTTINQVFGVKLASKQEVREFLAAQAEPHPLPGNAAALLYAQIGRVLTDLFFRPYTRKMWGLDLEEMDISVVKRVPIRFDDEDRYFPDDRFQVVPKDGYARLFEDILDHPRISVALNRPFDRRMLAGYRHCFNSMAIDEFYDYRFGPLPYRSIRFHHRELEAETWDAGAAVVNFTDDGPFTRETDWSRMPGHVVRPTRLKTVTSEQPCDYTANDQERYYPVKTADGRYQTSYARYKAVADTTPSMTFIGRCGTYQYLDMHQVINQSLVHVAMWLRGEAA